MGRSMLVFVILMTTIFGAVLTSVYRNIGGVPDVLIRNQLNKEIENLSDFILKRAVREVASESFLEDLQAMADSNEGGVVVGSSSPGTSLSDMVFTRVFKAGEEVYNNCKVDSIVYSFSSSNQHYKIQTFISGEMQGVKAARTAEMAFSFPILVEGTVTPNIVYLEFDQALRLNWLKEIFRLLFGIEKNDFPDSTSNNYNGTFHGLTFMKPTGNHENDDFADWGDGNNKLFVKLNGYNTFISIKEPEGESKPPDFMEMDTTQEFSLLCFAKIDKNGRDRSGGFLGILTIDDLRLNQGTLMWIPTEPSNPAMQNMPAAAIWFETKSKTNTKGNLHFEVTQCKPKPGETPDANGNYDVSQCELVPLKATITNFDRDTQVWKRVWQIFGYNYEFDKDSVKKPWQSFALTYNFEIVNGEEKGVLRGFVNGVEKASVVGGPWKLYPNKYGMTLGARDLRKANGDYADNNDKNRKHLFGVMDQAGMSDYALPEEEVKLWHEGVLKPTYMHYIRD